MSEAASQLIQLALNGIAIGSIYALVALGLVLTYKATEVLNFAHGDVGHGATALQLGHRLPAHDGRDRAHVPRLRAMAGRGATSARVDALGGAVHSDGAKNKGRRVVGAEGAAAAGGVGRLSGGAGE